ncbi:MAG: bifunctional phosphoribosylaminoimidazolecarboxamide formyltransferase/IMP cyclohydrolase [Ignavibacteria bacterium RBG_13_36_8]|nr:MAG: bifunctional phosphoribosylaminoimidazolecarboxamide formyltransferase/IMP cyclohydrolase [Ignavibacteria bacterium RBG_13_36_8]
MKNLALLSVSNKDGICEFAKKLRGLNYEIIATGNTARILKENKIVCTEISEYTAFPEIFSGRVKTLHPLIFGGILMRRNNNEDLKEAAANKVLPVDIVCVNLYPFPEVVNKADLPLHDKIENIDIGGPSLIRAAAKNYEHVSVLTDPAQYDEFIEEVEKGEISIATRQKLAYAAFAYTSYYDTLIANFFEKEFEQPKTEIRCNYKLSTELRYGENPHQKAYLFGNFFDYFEIIHGKEISYNNIIDLVAAVDLVNELEPNSCAIIKHTNPCGVAASKSVYDSFVNALSCDPVSAFGGIVAFNKEVDEKTAEKLNEIFLEIICAPDFSQKALEILQKKKNRRLVKVLRNFDSTEFNFKNIPGGIIAQEKDNSILTEAEIKFVTERICTSKEIENLKFAWIICKHTKSNAIVFVKDKKAIGVGAGQMSRIDSAKIAAMKATENGHDLKGAVAASDAFFPFADGVIEITRHGITAVIQPGGSVRDGEVIEAANKHNISMIFTGIRNFKH